MLVVLGPVFSGRRRRRAGCAARPPRAGRCLRPGRPDGPRRGRRPRLLFWSTSLRSRLRFSLSSRETRSRSASRSSRRRRRLVTLRRMPPLTIARPMRTPAAVAAPSRNISKAVSVKFQSNTGDGGGGRRGGVLNGDLDQDCTRDHDQEKAQKNHVFSPRMQMWRGPLVCPRISRSCASPCFFPAERRFGQAGQGGEQVAAFRLSQLGPQPVRLRGESPHPLDRAPGDLQVPCTPRPVRRTGPGRGARGTVGRGGPGGLRPHGRPPPLPDGRSRRGNRHGSGGRHRGQTDVEAGQRGEQVAGEAPVPALAGVEVPELGGELPHAGVHVEGVAPLPVRRPRPRAASGGPATVRIWWERWSGPPPGVDEVLPRQAQRATRIRRRWGRSPSSTPITRHRVGSAGRGPGCQGVAGDGPASRWRVSRVSAARRGSPRRALVRRISIG